MPSKTKARPSAPARRPVRNAAAAPSAKKKASSAKAHPPARPAPRPTPAAKAEPVEPADAPAPRSPDERRHVLSLSFLRDGDEFLARLETDQGQITELKNRSLDQLLTLVASELEDILE
jgi:hypothetical protein